MACLTAASRAGDRPVMSVALSVECESDKVRNAMSSFYTRYLRSLGDISVVKVSDAHALTVLGLGMRDHNAAGTFTGYTMSTVLTTRIPMLSALASQPIDDNSKDRISSVAFVNESYVTNIINTLPPGLESLESAIKSTV